MDQHRLFDRLKGTPHFETLRVLTLGEFFCGGTIDQTAIADLSDIDFSIANTSLFIETVETKEDHLSRHLRALLTDKMREIGFTVLESCSDLAKCLRLFGLTVEIRSISDIAEAFYALKQVNWSLFGSDLLVFLQALSEPASTLKGDQLAALFDLTRAWKLDIIAARLLIFRAINNYSAQSEYLRKNKSAIIAAARLPASLIASLDDRKSYDPALQSADLALESPIVAAIAFSLHFYALLREGEFNKLLVLLRDQYEQDPSALSFLDWDLFHERAPVNWGQRYLLNILLSVVLISPAITSRFESIEYSYGEGFVTNQIINYVNALKRNKQGMYQFARNIGAMGLKARAAVASFVLQKSVIEVYAYAFRDKPMGERFNIPMADLEVCHARIRLAYLFRESGTLPQDYCDRIIAEESAFRKMHRFQAVFRTSRIRIDWKYLAMEIAETLQDDFGFFFASLRKKGPAPTSALAEILSAIIAQRICELTLFDSATSLERALSNNLRHGVVIPRFLRVFTDAISNQTSSKPLSGRTNRTWYQSTFAKGGARLFQLEEEIIDLITSYQEDWLKVYPDGPLFRELKDRLASVLLKSISRSSAFSADELVAELVETQKDSINNILKQSRDILGGRVKSTIEKLVSIANIDIRPLNDRGSSEFLDSLSINLEHAFTQVAGWISLVDFAHSQSSEFELGDLIEEESNTFVISDRSKANIRYECIDRRGSRQRRIKDVKLSGKSFDLFDQIIHNSITNAHKRSGLRSDTQIVIRVTVEKEDLVVWCGNTFDPELLKQMRAHQTRAKAILAEVLKGDRKPKSKKRSKIAHREGGYGFIKIIDECQRVLNTTPTFNFPILASGGGQFIVEVRIPGATAVLA